MKFIQAKLPKLSAFWKRKEAAASAGFEEQVLQLLKRNTQASTMKTAIIAIVFGSMLVMSAGDAISRLLPRTHLAYIKVSGTIGDASTTGNGYKLVEAIDKAIDNDHALGILIHADSPGGSPSHAEMVYDRLMRHRASGAVWWPGEHCGVAFGDRFDEDAFEDTQCSPASRPTDAAKGGDQLVEVSGCSGAIPPVRTEAPAGGAAACEKGQVLAGQEAYRKPVVVVVDSLCASACYWIAVAADEIVVQQTAAVGSIGVRMDMWGLQGVANEYGVERRILTKGEHKALGDPFAPFNEGDKALLDQTIMEPIYRMFIAAVREGRGDRLKETADSFSGMVWLGEQVVATGMADRIGGSQQEREAMQARIDATAITPYNIEHRSMRDMLTATFHAAGKAFVQGVQDASASAAIEVR